MNQSQLLNVLTHLFPGSLFPRDYTVVVDGSGNASIALWNNALGVQPTSGDLTAALATMQLQQAQAAQTALIAAASAAAQTGGFTSNALGSVYTYPSGVTDQANLTACVVASQIAPAGTAFLFWCTSAAGASGFVSHTAAQIQAVGLAALAAIMAAKQKQLTLSQQIAAATTIAAVQAVVWS